MKEKCLSDKVIEIINEKLRRSIDCLQMKNWDTPLTGEPFYLSGIELMYLLFEIEKQFDIRIDSNDLDNYGFCSINNIVSIIERT